MLNCAALQVFIAILYLAHQLTPCSARTQRTKVVILGSGVAGIIAAKTLTENGIDDFVILEAQSYIGGRFKQAEVQGYKLEEGANWIHHVTEKDPIWKLKKRFGMKGKYTNYQDIIIRDEQGADVTNPDILKRFEKAAKQATELSIRRATEGKPDIPMRVGLEMVGWHPQTETDKVIEYREIDFEYTVKPEMDSFDQMETRGTDFFVMDSRGYGHIWKELAKPFQDKIKLDTVVKQVFYHKSGVRVITADGSVYLAKFAICTFSTNVLRSDLVKFSPPLPTWKMEALYKVRMGVYTKIFLKFPRKFWDSHEFILYAHRSRGHYPVWMDLEMPGIAPGSGLLHITVTNEEGRRVESQPESVTLSEIMRELRKVYGPNIPQAQAIFYSKWTQNPYVQGSYPNTVTGTTKDDLYNLQGNLNGLYFAGDAMDTQWLGFVQGAYFSGLKAATAITKCMQHRDCPHFYPKSNIVQSIYINQKGR